VDKALPAPTVPHLRLPRHLAGDAHRRPRAGGSALNANGVTQQRAGVNRASNPTLSYLLGISEPQRG